jgi:hypothetical protein
MILLPKDRAPPADSEAAIGKTQRRIGQLHLNIMAYYHLNYQPNKLQAFAREITAN